MIVLITGILNSYYSSVGNKINFPIGVINNLALSYVAFKNNNYGLVIFNLLFFMPINIKGYFEWNKNSNKDVVERSNYNNFIDSYWSFSCISITINSWRKINIFGFIY